MLATLAVCPTGLLAIIDALIMNNSDDSRSNAHRVTHLFDAYASNLTAHFPGLQDTFRCPICLRDYTRDAITTHEISLEHIIPLALGGRLVTLSCTTCNSQAGTELDSHLVQRIRFWDAIAGKSDSPLRVTVVVDKGEFRSDVYFSKQDPNVWINGKTEFSNPELHKLAKAEFEAGPPAFSLKGRTGFDPGRSLLAALRSAYLLMFYYFGYCFLYKHQCSKQLRKLIRALDTENSAVKAMRWINDYHGTTSVTTLSYSSINSFYVLLELSTAHSKHHLGVALPIHNQGYDDFFAKWEEFVSEGTVTLSLSPIPYYPAFVSNPANKDLLIRIGDTLLV